MTQLKNSTDILLCSVEKRLNTYEYRIKSYLTSYKKFFGVETLIVEPQSIYVNGIRFKAHLADQFFIDTTIKDKKALFIIDSESDDHIIGDIFLLSSNDNQHLHLPETLKKMVEKFVDSDFKLAV